MSYVAPISLCLPLFSQFHLSVSAKVPLHASWLGSICHGGGLEQETSQCTTSHLVCPSFILISLLPMHFESVWPEHHDNIPPLC